MTRGDEHKNIRPYRKNTTSERTALLIERISPFLLIDKKNCNMHVKSAIEANAVFNTEITPIEIFYEMRQKHSKIKQFKYNSQ